MADVYFFGCWNRPGHFLYDVSGRMVHSQRLPAELQMGKLDSPAFEATPTPHQPLGVTRLQHITPREGAPAVWTALSMWDRSGDTRPGSHSIFLALGVFTEDEMWAIAARDFPEVVKRIKSQKGPL